MCGRVGQRAYDVEEFGHRAGPAMRDDQRKRVRLRRANVQEVDVDPVDGRYWAKQLNRCST